LATVASFVVKGSGELEAHIIQSKWGVLNHSLILDNVAYTIKQIIPPEEFVVGNGLPSCFIIHTGGH
jgi:hypothetical protein